MLRFATLATLVLAAGATVLAPVEEAKAQPSVTAKPGEWRYLNSDPGATRYSPLDQITKDNFKDLKLAWRWKPAIGPAPSSLGGTAQGNGDPTFAIYRSESTPVMANGVLYTAAGGQRVVAAIDAATGKQLWMWTGMDEGGRDGRRGQSGTRRPVHKSRRLGRSSRDRRRSPARSSCSCCSSDSPGSSRRAADSRGATDRVGSAPCR